MFFSLFNEINKLISKKKSDIYLIVTFEKKWLFQNVDFLSLKILALSQFLGALTHANIINFKTSWWSLRAKEYVAFPLF